MSTIAARKKRSGKKAVKKTAKPKAQVEVTIKRKVLGEAPEEHHFYLRDGKKLRNLFELVDELEAMHDDIFWHHANDERNDFANWIEHIFDEKDLAQEVRKMENRLDAQRAIIRHLVKAVMELKT